MPNLIILDVGHGNCAVLQDETDILIFDATIGSILLEYLLQNNQSEILALVLSHADTDHISGAIALLSSAQFKVKHVYLNPDASKSTRKFLSLRIALADAQKRFNTVVHTELTSTTTGNLDLASLHIEVIAPTPELAAGGPGSQDLKGRILTSNSLSAVCRILRNGTPLVLLPGDLDMTGMLNLQESGAPADARLLVFPHHGGQPGRFDPTEFAKKLLELVKPATVVFSLARDKYENPDPRIVEEVLRQHANIRIACTQLSEHCASELPKTAPSHLTNLPASGKSKNSCCAGSIEVDLSSGTFSPASEAHTTFVQLNAPTALCRRDKQPL